MSHILSIDQGTTSSRALVFDGNQKIKATAQLEFKQIYPHAGWVEHDPRDLWNSVLQTAREALQSENLSASDISAIGITNQRETTLLWDRRTGEPVYNAIVWQDRRTAHLCDQLRAQGYEPRVTAITGLLLDPYFSGTKLSWLLENVEGARERAEAGELCFGTVDSWIIWNLTGGQQHLTDATNAARTMLYDIHRGKWSDEMCDMLNIPKSVLPEVKDCSADFGTTDKNLLGREIPILGVAGDQQAATIGQACFEPGMVKSTYGTGCFALMNTGTTAIASNNRLLTTIAYRLDGQVTYAIEGSIFIAGAVVQWLRDGLGIIAQAHETAQLFEEADAGQEVIMVPAFTGLGAPYWAPEARGAVFGLNRNTGPAEFAKAALQSVGFQTRDLIEAMIEDTPHHALQRLRVDGGMSASDPAMQFVSDILGIPADRPNIQETTALGAAWLAGHRAGLWPGQEEFAASWSLQKSFSPSLPHEQRMKKYENWQRAVGAVLSLAQEAPQ